LADLNVVTGRRSPWDEPKRLANRVQSLKYKSVDSSDLGSAMGLRGSFGGTGRLKNRAEQRDTSEYRSECDLTEHAVAWSQVWSARF
jgi:hypothetical protein